MHRLRGLFMRVLGAFGMRRGDDFDAELASHIALDTEAGRQRGLREEEARRQALIRLGGAEQTRQAHRDRGTLHGVESLRQDLRYSLRTLAKHYVVTGIAIFSIGLGIGANATIFSMVSRFVLRPAAVGDPATLETIYTTRQGERCCNSFSLPLYRDVRDQAHSFSGVAAYFDVLPASMQGNGGPERVWGQAVTTNFFDVAGVRMMLGRGFAASENHVQAVVLEAGLWRARFNADAEIVGKTVMLSGRPFTVVGVAAPSFHGIDSLLNARFWVPLGEIQALMPIAPESTSRSSHWLSVVGRLRTGVTRAEANAELATLAKHYAEAYPQTDKGGGFRTEQAGSLAPKLKRLMDVFLAALLLVVLLVLAIAATNVANLLFAQAVGRQREMAVRLALGATRRRLQRQMLMESLLMALAGGIAGVLMSVWSTRALSAFRVPAPIPLDLGLGIDWRVLLYSFGLSAVGGVLLGAGPAWAASRPRLASVLKGEELLAGRGHRWSLRAVLVVAQTAMAVVLLCLTGLFLRSLESAARIDIGFNRRDVVMLSVDPRLHGYSAARTVQFLAQLREQAAALPGVVSAACTDVAPLSGGNRSDGFHVLGAPAADAGNTSVDLYMATPGYFAAMGIPRMMGRDFGEETASSARTAVVNRAFVAQVMHGANPIGQQVVGAGVVYRIIGVVGDTKSRTLGEAQRAVLYRSLKQSVGSDPSMLGYTLIVRTAGNSATTLAALRHVVTELDPAMAVFHETTMEDHVRDAFFLPHLAALLFGIFGGMGLILAAIGIYGVISYSVSRRTHEIGIRVALGAQPAAVERLILRQGLKLCLIALMVGWPAAWMLARLAASFLYGIQPHDTLTFLAAPLFLFAIAMIASWIPARRASAVDPVKALRFE